MRLYQLMDREHLDRLFSSVEQREFCYLPSCLTAPGELLSWASLNELISYRDLQGRDMLLVKDGRAANPNVKTILRKPIPGVDDVPQPPSVYAALVADGHTLVLNGIQNNHPPIYGVCADLSWKYNINVGANMYASWKPDSPFGIHWDEHDVIAVQLEGMKNWDLFEQKEDLITQLGSDKGIAPEGEPSWSGTLTKGDVLFVPRGLWHRAGTGNEPSLHLTIGLKHPHIADYFDLLKHAARANPRFWDKLSGTGDQEDLDRAATLVASSLPSLRKAVTPCSATEFFKAKVSKRPALSLPYAGSNLLPPRSAVLDLRPDVRVEESQVGGGLVLTDGRSRWGYPPSLGAVLTHMIDGHPVRLDQFIESGVGEGVSAERMCQIVSHSVSEGILRVNPPTLPWDAPPDGSELSHPTLAAGGLG